MNFTTGETPKRLTPRAETIRLLLAKSGNQCGFDSCTEVIFNDSKQLIAECCHIEAALPEGERFNPNQTNEERRSFDNLIFLCHKHHKETDNTNIYTVPVLKELKSRHHKKFSEKEIIVNPSHIDTIMDKFNEIVHNITETLNTVKRIEITQNELLDKLDEKITSNFHLSINEFYDPPATINFVGREQEIFKLESNFEKYNTFIIQGISGIGKSTLIANYISNVKGFDVLWIDYEAINNKEILFLTISKFLIQKFNDHSFEKCLQTGDEKTVYRNLIYSLNSYKICIVFDAVNILENSFLSVLNIFNQYLQSSKIIITTTLFLSNQKWENATFNLSLTGLSFGAFQKMSEQYLTSKLSSGDLRELFLLSGGHPYLLKIASSEINFQSTKRFFLDFKTENQNEFSKYIVSKVVSDLNEDEKKFIQHVLILDIPFQLDIENYITEISFISTLKSLQEKFIIEKLGNNSFIISDYLKPTLISIYKLEITNEYIYNAIDYLKSKDYTSVIENFSLVKLLLKAKLYNSASNEFSNLTSKLMRNGYFNLFVSLINQLSDLDGIVKTWPEPMYALGRVYRIQQDYEKALKAYNEGIAIASDSFLYPYFYFEKASILSYLSDIKEIDEYRTEAESIYETLGSSQNLTISLQSKLGLTRLLIKRNLPTDAIFVINSIINNNNLQDFEPYVRAQIWHSLGDAYRKNDEYNKAFESFDISIDYYKEAIEKNGMNAFEGLYHLYLGYGQTYSDGKDYISAAEMFGINVSLAANFGLINKYEQALSDYGYHLVLSEQFSLAISVLGEYYDIIAGKENIAELPFIYGCMLFSFWYNGLFLEAIEFLGLYINACIVNDERPLVTVIEGFKEGAELDLIEIFKKGMKILVIPDENSMTDFQFWMKEVITRIPELENPLNTFLLFEKE
ncbi:tetratricopeptide repeat protein [Chryseobacterium populi]|uniref:NB-ARC domain-containing protein,tetratricopeptide repeat protein n=1 Tax=Chryseobacterium populi TaxID=1144316 RepID=J2KJT3_9FLAO|nr:tetratricopeptide repeat protein [Chryseobacterium populi]EJL73338.1 NB-ARC domain-containing protein,tetratricopeptide repeat protein [Chryseobacterium populi]